MSDMPSSEQDTFQRPSCDYENLSARFKLQDRNFERQYAHLYSERLISMRPSLEKAAKRKWGEETPLCRLYQLVTGQTQIVVGTIFKSMELKPSILKEISEDRNLTPQPARERFSSNSDFLVLEDELQRVVLTGNIDAQTAITGIVIALKGFENDSGKFEVEDTCYVDLPCIEETQPLDDDRYLILMSGLGIGSNQTDLMSLQLMVDIITGQLGTADQQEMFSKVVRVIVAGNSLSESTRDKDVLTTAKYLTKKSQAGTVEAVKTLDHILVQLTSCIQVDLMAGDFDPANSSLPQQPFHRCMFPQSSVYSTFNSVTNPYEAKIAGIRVLGTSGQSVTDIYHFSTMEDRLAILEKTLRYGHLAPSAPDTLACYPFYDQDPFIIKECPAIYFAGNQPRFQTKKHTGSNDQEVLLVTIPSFQETKSCAIINLRTMDCQPLIFSANLNST